MEIKSTETTVNKVEQPKGIKVQEKGSIRALAASQAVTLATLPVGIGAVAGMQKVAKSLSPEQIKVLNETADRLIKETKLADKGVKIHNVVSAGLNFTTLPDSVYDVINQYSAIANGKNAAFLNNDMKDIFGNVLHEKNSIIINREKLPTAVFHEIGHAFNYNSSKFWKAMQGVRTPAMLIAAGLALFGAVTKKAEAEDGKELTAGQKAKNFVRDNAGILASLSMLPVIAEESMASIRAAKWASKNLTKDLAKKVNRSNIFGAISYTVAAVGLALAAQTAVKVKDNIMAKQKEKALKEAEQKNTK